MFDAAPEERRRALHNQSLRDKFMRGHAATITSEIERMVADWDDEVCPPFPQAPIIPAHVWPLPIDDVDETWVVRYHHGLAETLDQARGWVRNAPIVVEAHDKALRAIAAAS